MLRHSAGTQEGLKGASSLMACDDFGFMISTSRCLDQTVKEVGVQVESGASRNGADVLLVSSRNPHHLTSTFKPLQALPNPIRPPFQHSSCRQPRPTLLSNDGRSALHNRVWAIVARRPAPLGYVCRRPELLSPLPLVLTPFPHHQSPSDSQLEARRTFPARSSGTSSGSVSRRPS